MAGLVEALAAGVPILGPPALERLFGPAAAYARAEDVPDALKALVPSRRSALAQAARELHEKLTSPAALIRRLEEQLGPPPTHRPTLTLRRELGTQRRALFLSPNGIGMGHLTRLLAVARRCSPGVEPVFLSMSQAVGVVETMGYVGEYFPYHQHSGETADAWNAALRARLDEAIAFYDPRCIVLDGNMPYQALVECRPGHPNRAFVWIRRGLWREDAGGAALERSRHFDLVIEPGELAAELDRGPTVGRSEDVLRTAAVVFHEPSELLSREAARSALGLDPERTAVLVQLGSRNNFDYASIDQIVLEELASRPEIEVVVLDWIIGELEQQLPPHVRRLRAYPAARYLRAFDFAISAAGYNSFHELMSYGVPSILVPNENPMMDAQELRGLWAERQGLAYLVRRHELYRASWAVRSLLDPEQRERMGRRCALLPACDGAASIARCLDLLSAATRLSPHPDRITHALTRSG
jgi:UDP:flavonoid glycosyltransferase YjiC (YdhE family)